MADLRTAAILLAAGESTRMGSPKPLLAWGNETLIEYQVRQLRYGGCDPVIVVLGAKADSIQPVVEPYGAMFVINKHYAEGRATSVRAGAQALDSDIDRALVLNVDQPRPAAVHRALLEAMKSANASIAVATHVGKRGHPIAFDRTLFVELLKVSDATLGIKDVMVRHEADLFEVPFDTPVVTLDINRPEDYEAAKAVYFQEVSQ